jgi:hypothetical protein
MLAHKQQHKAFTEGGVARLFCGGIARCLETQTQGGVVCAVSASQNMLAHEDEIYSRPARTWFQTEKEKKSAAAAAAAAAAQGKTVMEMEAAAGT